MCRGCGEVVKSGWQEVRPWMVFVSQLVRSMLVSLWWKYRPATFLPPITLKTVYKCLLQSKRRLQERFTVPRTNTRRQRVGFTRNKLLRTHSCVVTSRPHCYLTLCARRMWTDTHFWMKAEKKTAIITLKIIRRLRKTCSCPGNPAHEICAPLTNNQKGTLLNRSVLPQLKCPRYYVGYSESSNVCAYLSRILETVNLRMCSDFLYQLRSHGSQFAKFLLCLCLFPCVKHV